MAFWFPVIKSRVCGLSWPLLVQKIVIVGSACLQCWWVRLSLSQMHGLMGAPCLSLASHSEFVLSALLFLCVTLNAVCVWTTKNKLVRDALGVWLCPLLGKSAWKVLVWDAQGPQNWADKNWGLCYAGAIFLCCFFSACLKQNDLLSNQLALLEHSEIHSARLILTVLRNREQDWHLVPHHKWKGKKYTYTWVRLLSHTCDFLV